MHAVPWSSQRWLLEAYLAKSAIFDFDYVAMAPLALNLAWGLIWDFAAWFRIPVLTGYLPSKIVFGVDSIAM